MIVGSLAGGRAFQDGTGRTQNACTQRNMRLTCQTTYSLPFRGSAANRE